MRLLAPLLAVLASPLTAEEVTQEFLEQPGMVWVSGDLPFPVLEGLIVTMIPYATFNDGIMETGFFSGSQIIFDGACPDYNDCSIFTNDAPFRRGAYSIEDGVLSTDAQPLDEWVFDRRDTALLVQASDLVPSGQTALERNGDVLIQVRPEGVRRYHAVPEDERYQMIAFPWGMQLAAYQTYECSVDTLVAIKALPQDQLRPDQLGYLAAAEIFAISIDLNAQTDALVPLPHISDVSDLSEDLQQQYHQLQAEHRVISLPVGLIASDLPPQGELTEPSAETLELLESIVGRLAETVADPDAVIEFYETNLPNVILTAKFMSDFNVRLSQGVDPIDAVCAPSYRQ